MGPFVGPSHHAPSAHWLYKGLWFELSAREALSLVPLGDLPPTLAPILQKRWRVKCPGLREPDLEGSSVSCPLPHWQLPAQPPQASRSPMILKLAGLQWLPQKRSPSATAGAGLLGGEDTCWALSCYEPEAIKRGRAVTDRRPQSASHGTNQPQLAASSKREARSCVIQRHIICNLPHGENMCRAGRHVMRIAGVHHVCVTRVYACPSSGTCLLPLCE